MANRTVKDAKSIKGTNPQYLVEKIIRSRIYDSKYWKEECFALTAELLVDKAMELRFVGGVHGGNVKPCPFLCLILKMLQIQPEKDIIVEFIRNEDFKYVRCLGAFYMRLTGTSQDCYNYLEPLLNDNRKIRRQNREGAFELVFVDEFVDELLKEERICDIILPRIQKRYVLEETNELVPRVSILEADDDDDDESEPEPELVVEKKEKSHSRHSARKHSSGEKRRHRSHSSSSGDRKKKSDRRTSRERDRRPDKSSSSSHRDKDRNKDKRRDKDTDDRRSNRDHDRKDSRRDRERERERERPRAHEAGRSRGKEWDRSRDRDRNHYRSRY